MDRKTIARAVHGVTLKSRVGGAQNLFLATDQIRLVAPGVFTATAEAQSSCLLQSLTIDAQTLGEQTQGLITEISVAGQSTMVSDQSACLSAFSPTAFNENARSLGISVNNNMKVVVQGSIASATGAISLGLQVDPLADDMVKTRAEQAHSYNFCFGMGEKAIPAAGSATLSARSNRAVTLGDIILQNNTLPAAFVLSEDLVITSLTIGGLEMLNGVTGAQEIGLACFAANASNYSGVKLGYPINPQTEVAITVKNYDAVNAATVAGAIFCEPWQG
jgi:hypothetical protein